jgi:hypothetical protein
MSIRAQGRHIGFRTDKPGLLARVRACLPPGWKPSDRELVRRVYSLRIAGYGMKGRSGGPRKTHHLYINAARVARSRDIQELLDTLEADLQLYAAEQATRRIFVHAGVVGWKGQAILIPGRSHSGKSTLVAELLRLGATYYSDEYAALDARGRVHPYLRPLSLRTGRTGESPRRIRPEELGAESGKGPLPVGLVAVTTYQEGGPWRPRRLTPGKGVLALLDNTVPARRRPKASMDTLGKVVLTAEVLKGPRGEAREVAAALLDRLDRSSSPW